MSATKNSNFPLSRPVIAFALLRQCSELMSTDLLSGIGVLVRPLVSDLAGQSFDSHNLAMRLSNAYGISIPDAALEALVDRLVIAGILVLDQRGQDTARAVYAEAVDSINIEDDSENQFQGLIDEYLSHAQGLLQSAGKSIADDELVKGFLRHLATLDFLSIRAKPQINPETATKIVGATGREKAQLSEELANPAAIDSLVASYITWLKLHRPEGVELLSKVADGALAAELVFDLQAPTAVSKLTNTTVIIDTPLILSYLDLSSVQDKQDADNLFTQIADAGAKIAAFEHSLEEAEGVLAAIQLARSAGAAYGPSVHRFAGGLFRAYFDSMIGKVESKWKQENFGVIKEVANHYHKNFTSVEEDELMNAIRISPMDRVLTRERDARSVAETMRLLGGGHIPINNIAACRYVFVTNNGGFQKRAEAYLRRKNHIARGDFNPIITGRYIAGLCWLICGGKSDQSPTVAKLLANCAAALRLNPEIAERTKKFLAQIDPRKASHFEALMTNERAAQYLAEVTLGDISVITASNAPEILEEVERRAAEKIAIAKDREYQEKIRNIENSKEEILLNHNRLISNFEQNRIYLDAQNLEIDNLKKANNVLESRYEKSEENFRQSRENIEAQNRIVEELKAAAENLKSNLEKKEVDERARKQRIKEAAHKYASGKTLQIRFAGGVFLIIFIFLLGYVDKFFIPGITLEKQSLANFLLITTQAIMGITGVSLFFDRAIGKPVAYFHEKFYKRKLAELGEIDGDEESQLDL